MEPPPAPLLHHGTAHTLARPVSSVISPSRTSSTNGITSGTIRSGTNNAVPMPATAGTEAILPTQALVRKFPCGWLTQGSGSADSRYAEQRFMKIQDGAIGGEAQ